MNLSVRKYYIDNLRWIILLILIPYHAAMAWNTWGEPNYIFFEGDRLISSIIVFFNPYFMPLLFVLAGISTKYALKKRTGKEYLVERAKRLIVPLVFGIIVLMPIMSYIGDKFNCSYEDGFLKHYGVFFTKFTDLTGADGGFSLGQFWFCLYLFVISGVSIGALAPFKNCVSKSEKAIPFWLVIVLGLPLPILSGLISIGGKSLVEYTYLFVVGYFVFSNDEVIDRAVKNRRLLFCVGSVASILNVHLFLWTDKEYALLNTICKYVSEWFMIIALIGLAKRYLNFTGKISVYMSRRSFLFYTWHFIWVVLTQYLLYEIVGFNTPVLFVCTVIVSYFITFICSEVCIRIPFLCFVTGTKYRNNK